MSYSSLYPHSHVGIASTRNALKHREFKELAQVTQKSGQVGIQTQLEHVLTEGLIV